MVLIAALGIRVWYVEHTPYKAVNDGGTYNRLASMIARTGDYDTGRAPGSGAGGSRGPTAYFPPGYPYLLAAVDLLTGHQAGGKTALKPERVAQALLGTVAVGLLGLVALEAFGGWTALIAMTLAAAYPVFIELTGTLVAENLLIVLELGAVWAALRALRSPRPYGWIAMAGILTGLATLTHENAALFLIPFGYVAVRVERTRPDPARGSLRSLAALVVLVLATGLTVVPWTIRNAVELHHFVPVSDETGITLRGTYNPESAAARPVHYKWRFFWKIPQDAKLRHTAGRYTEIALGDRLQSRAMDYIGAHPAAPLDAGVHNALRMIELEGAYGWRASARAVGLHPDVAETGVIAFWIIGVLALIGALTRPARDGPRWLWWLPALYALSIVFINVETPRFREPIDPFLLLLAACALAAPLERLRERRSGLRGTPVGGRGRAPRLARHGKLIEVRERLA